MVPLNKKPDAAKSSIGLVKMGVFYHDFFSTPMLLSSSELIFETSRSAPARATNKSREIETTIANIIHSFLYSYYNHSRFEKIYPLTVLILSSISIM
jgi:hypothetical protein